MIILESVETAYEHMDNKNYSVAVLHLESAIQSPEFSSSDKKHLIYYSLGVCYLELKAYDDALSALQTALSYTAPPYSATDYATLADTHDFMSRAYEEKSVAAMQPLATATLPKSPPNLLKHWDATLGNRIKRLRTNRGLTQEALVHGLITVGMLEQIETNKALPSKSVVRWLLRRIKLFPSKMKRKLVPDLVLPEDLAVASRNKPLTQSDHAHLRLMLQEEVLVKNMKILNHSTDILEMEYGVNVQESITNTFIDMLDYMSVVRVSKLYNDLAEAAFRDARAVNHLSYGGTEKYKIHMHDAERFIKVAETVSPPAHEERGRAYKISGQLVRNFGEYDAAMEQYEKAIVVFGKLNLQERIDEMQLLISDLNYILKRRDELKGLYKQGGRRKGRKKQK